MSLLMNPNSFGDTSQNSLSLIKIVERVLVVVGVAALIIIAVLAAQGTLDVIPKALQGDNGTNPDAVGEITGTAVALFGTAAGVLGLSLLILVIGYFYGNRKPLRQVYLNGILGVGMVVSLSLFAAGFFDSGVSAAGAVFAVLAALLLGILMFYIFRNRIYKFEWVKKMAKKLKISEEQFEDMAERAAEERYVGVTKDEIINE
jgi:hypothetical protein